jgi:hypothetical protein
MRRERIITTRRNRFAWRPVRALGALRRAGAALENWVDSTTVNLGIDMLDVLEPLTERHSASWEV